MREATQELLRAEYQYTTGITQSPVIIVALKLYSVEDPAKCHGCYEVATFDKLASLASVFDPRITNQ